MNELAVGRSVQFSSVQFSISSFHKKSRCDKREIDKTKEKKKSQSVAPKLYIATSVLGEHTHTHTHRSTVVVKNVMKNVRQIESF